MQDASMTQTAHPKGNEASKRSHFGDGRPSKKRKLQRKLEKKTTVEGTNEEVLLHEIRSSLSALRFPTSPSEVESEDVPERFTEVDVEITSLSSTGDGLGPSHGHIFVVPFSIPGDVVRTKVIRHFPEEKYILADFVKVVKPSHLRDDTRIKCPYFASCGGCQFQMMDYADQLRHKKTIVEKAYRNFSGLSSGLVPTVDDIIGSPQQYGYRTKLTPHFDGPQGGRRKNRNNEQGKRWEEVPPIGFMKKGQRKTLDIEECPIGTDAVQSGLKRERKRVAENIESYKRGATLLLRENTKRVPKDTTGSPGADGVGPVAPEGIPEDAIVTDYPTHTDYKTCITDNNAISTEYVDSNGLSNPAGAFFQNNNSILPTFTSYIRSHILTPPSDPFCSSKTFPITNLIDAYCGSGLFSITLASLFKSTTGIDIAPSSIECARSNAVANKVENTNFIAADAAALFKEITYPPDETVVVIDPPRKGCDASFLSQLMQFGPKRVVYVSCNVHTQARDLGVLAGQKNADGTERDGEPMYEIERLGGFDFFPQTSHVEGVAFLTRKDRTE
ncbi:MAG: Arp2/3 complex subunit, actin nucleation center [Chaenotheca gracillima]|nr:MAG: Arp2/3 complex subunit, actin nucleation center [Chaenotheca gracillima]